MNAAAFGVVSLVKEKETENLYAMKQVSLDASFVSMTS